MKNYKNSLETRLSQDELNKIAPEIRDAVIILDNYDFKIIQSWGYKDPELPANPLPTVRFIGEKIDLFRAYEICQSYGLDVNCVSEVWIKVPLYLNGSDTPFGNSKTIGQEWEKPSFEISFFYNEDKKSIWIS